MSTLNFKTFSLKFTDRVDCTVLDSPCQQLLELLAEINQSTQAVETTHYRVFKPPRLYKPVGNDEHYSLTSKPLLFLFEIRLA